VPAGQVLTQLVVLRYMLVGQDKQALVPDPLQVEQAALQAAHEAGVPPAA